MDGRIGQTKQYLHCCSTQKCLLSLNLNNCIKLILIFLRLLLCLAVLGIGRGLDPAQDPASDSTLKLVAARVLRIRIKVMRIRILLFTLIRIRIPPFTGSGSYLSL